MEHLILNLVALGDMRQYKSDEQLFKICSNYNELSDLEKLQLGQLELDSQNYNVSKIKDSFSQYLSDVTSAWITLSILLLLGIAINKTKAYA